MGIRKYFSHIVQKYPHIISKLNAKHSKSRQRITHFYLDCNSIIYDAFAQLSKELPPNEVNGTAIIQRTIEKIRSYIEIICPTTCVMLAFDGVAPVAKVAQQRSRRYKSLLSSELLCAPPVGAATGAPTQWSTTNITPGMTFMKELDAAIIREFASASSAMAASVARVIVSTSAHAGEGEHKIFEQIRATATAEEHVIAIYGLDADLIMLSLLHIYAAKQVYLFRETPEFIANISADLSPSETYLFDISKLSYALWDEYSPHSHSQVGGGIQHTFANLLQFIRSYVFTSFMLGNDFLPHFPALNIRTGGIEKLFGGKLGLPCIVIDKQGDIMWNKLSQFVAGLATNEGKYVAEEYNARTRMEGKIRREFAAMTTENKLSNLPLIDRSVEHFISNTTGGAAGCGWQERYYEKLFPENTTIGDITKNYIEGLQWNWKYYTAGCKDWYWKYEYHYPPLLRDLSAALLQPSAGLSLVRPGTTQPISPLTQLCYVMPLEYLRRESDVNPDVKKFVDALTRAPAIARMYDRVDVEFQLAYCRYFWECHVHLPEICLQQLVDFQQDALDGDVRSR